MKKIVTYDYRAFMKNEHVSTKKNLGGYGLMGVGTTSYSVFTPTIVFASNGGFMEMWEAIMGIVDWIAAGIFVFAGITWMFGKQTRGIELIVCGTAGYLLARHAIDIRDFLKSI